MKKRYSIYNKILPAIFILFLIIPFINGNFEWYKNNASNENRNLNQRPEFNIQKLDPFPRKYEAYFNDHFGIRSLYLDVKNYLDFFIFRQTIGKDKIIIGKESWFYNKRNMIPRFAMNELFTENELSRLDSILRERVKYCHENDMEYLMVIIPNKASIYPEYLPDYYQYPKYGDPINRSDQFIQSLQGKDIEKYVYYLKEDLMKEKEKDQIYAKHDHHWNNLGGYIAGGYIIDKLIENGVQMTNPLVECKVETRWETLKKGNLAAALGIENILDDEIAFVELKDCFPEVIVGEKRNYVPPEKFAYPWEFERVYHTNDSTKPKAMIVRDSFTNMMLPPFAGAFSESIFLWDNWQYKMNERIAAKEKPDLILHLIVEQNLDHLLRD